MSLLTDPLGEFGPRSGRHTRREPTGSRDDASADSIDAETRDVIEKFEALYAQVEPAASEPAAHSADGDLRIEFPEDLDLPVEPRMRAPSVAPAVRKTTAAAAAAPRPVGDDLGIDEAFALLRAAESRGRAAADRNAAEPDDDSRAPSLPNCESSTPTAKARVVSTAYEPSQPRVDWAVRAKAAWPRALGAAAVALIAGVGLGYLAGHGPATRSTYAKIEISPHGGAQLRFDYELDRK